MYLNGAGIYAFHEAWRYAKDAKELRKMMVGRGDVVVNSDSTNALFLEELRAEFPDALYVRIVRDLESVRQSIERSYGRVHNSILLKWHRAVMDTEVDYEIPYHSWTPEVTKELWQFLGGKWLDTYWHDTSHDMKVELSNERIFKDHTLSQTHYLDHIAAKLRG